MMKRVLGVLAGTAIAAGGVLVGTGTANAAPPCGLSKRFETGGGWYLYNCSFYSQRFRIYYHPTGSSEPCLAGKELRVYASNLTGKWDGLGSC